MWGVISVWMNELFPTPVRASGLGVTATIGRLVNVASPLMVGAIATQSNLTVALLPFPLLSLLTVVILLAWKHSPSYAGEIASEPQSIALTPD
jgi:putative MFS transporter